MATADPRRRLIYLACPWAPLGGGMFKVSDYLVQYQALAPEDAELRPLDTRGGGHVLLSLYYLPRAMMVLLWQRLTGRLAGVHVNMAERASTVRKGLLVVFARLIGAPVLIHLHSAELHRLFRAWPSAAQALLRWVFSLADEVLVLGQQSRSFVLDELRCRPERVYAVLNGVPEATRPRRPDLPHHVFRVLFLGNLSARKGVSELLQALASLPGGGERWHAVIAGGGDVEGFRAEATRRGLGSNVEFFGWARQDQAADLLAAADVLVLPSYDEGLPLVILEALANGVAVVCTPVGEIPSTLGDGKEAIFVAPRDAAALAQALARLIEEPALRQALELQGRAFYERGFSIEAFFNAVATIHQRVFGIRARFDARGSGRGHGS